MTLCRPQSEPDLATQKKEEFPGSMKNILPGNSFPQICVVSVGDSLEVVESAQDYGSSVD
jgi:hypothetical protein